MKFGDERHSRALDVRGDGLLRRDDVVTTGPENRRADPHMGRAELDRDGEIGAHAHRRFFSPLRAAIFAVSAKCGAGASSTGGMHISPETCKP